MSELSKALIELDQLSRAKLLLTEKRSMMAGARYRVAFRAITRDIAQCEARINMLADGVAI